MNESVCRPANDNTLLISHSVARSRSFINGNISDYIVHNNITPHSEMTVERGTLSLTQWLSLRSDDNKTNQIWLKQTIAALYGQKITFFSAPLWLVYYTSTVNNRVPTACGNPSIVFATTFGYVRQIDTYLYNIAGVTYIYISTLFTILNRD